MVGGGAAKEKYSVPNPVVTMLRQNMNARCFLKPGESLTSPGIRSGPKRSPFLPRPNLYICALILLIFGTFEGAAVGNLEGLF